MPISRRTHAVLDLATAGFLLMFPRALGAGRRFSNITTAMALAKLSYGVVTRHELSVAKVLPMKGHLTLDAAGGAALCALPLVLDEQQPPAVTACAIGTGLLDLAAAGLTERQSLPAQVRGVTTGTTARLPGEDQPDTIARERRVPAASVIDSMKLWSGVFLPTVAKGPIIRRRTVVSLAESMGLDTAAVQTMQRMRERYGSGPLMLRVPLRRQAVLLDGADVRRVLTESPEPFATASTEKQAALAHFEPKGALVSHGSQRKARRQLNEQTLEADRAIHPLAAALLPIVEEEAEALMRLAAAEGELRWEEFFDTWFRIVRRAVFGNAARDDRRVTDLMFKLRRDGNWAFLKPIRRDLRSELHQRIGRYLDRGEAGSLAGYMAKLRPSGLSAPEQQIPQWLFAFDPAAMATFRALALLATHDEQMQRAREQTDRGSPESAHRPVLRAAVLESLRLWPTTPMILRQTTRSTKWRNGIMPAHTGILIFAPFFHRDETRVPFAHAFNPDVWLEDDPQVKGNPPRGWPFVPFSAGPGICPGRNVVLLLGSAMLAEMIRKRSIRLIDEQRLPAGGLPGTLDHFTLRFHISGGSPASRSAAAAREVT